MVNNMQRAVMLDHLASLPDGVEASDPNDAFLLAMALEGDADYLVTGDRRAKLLQRESIGRTPILTAAAFCAEALWAERPGPRLAAHNPRDKDLCAMQ
jgi:predicted nucleic acid-binding protein